jgi:hypothetical protein
VTGVVELNITSQHLDRGCVTDEGLRHIRGVLATLPAGVTLRLQLGDIRVADMLLLEEVGQAAFHVGHIEVIGSDVWAVGAMVRVLRQRFSPRWTS